MTKWIDRLDEIQARADAATEGPGDTSTTSWEPEARMVRAAMAQAFHVDMMD